MYARATLLINFPILLGSFGRVGHFAESRINLKTILRFTLCCKFVHIHVGVACRSAYLWQSTIYIFSFFKQTVEGSNDRETEIEREGKRGREIYKIELNHFYIYIEHS